MNYGVVRARLVTRPIDGPDNRLDASGKHQTMIRRHGYVAITESASLRLRRARLTLTIRPRVLLDVVLDTTTHRRARTGESALSVLVYARLTINRQRIRHQREELGVDTHQSIQSGEGVLLS